METEDVVEPHKWIWKNGKIQNFKEEILKIKKLLQMIFI